MNDNDGNEGSATTSHISSLPLLPAHPILHQKKDFTKIRQEIQSRLSDPSILLRWKTTNDERMIENELLESLTVVPWTLHPYTNGDTRDKESANEQNARVLPKWSHLSLRNLQNKAWADSRLRRGLSYAQHRDLPTQLLKAEECYRQGLELLPNHVGLLTAYGVLCVNSASNDSDSRHRLEMARHLLKSAMIHGNNSTNVEARQYLGIVDTKLETLENKTISNTIQQSSGVLRTTARIQDVMTEKLFLAGDEIIENNGATNYQNNYPLLPDVEWNDKHKNDLLDFSNTIQKSKHTSKKSKRSRRTRRRHHERKKRKKSHGHEELSTSEESQNHFRRSKNHHRRRERSIPKSDCSSLGSSDSTYKSSLQASCNDFGSKNSKQQRHIRRRKRSLVVDNEDDATSGPRRRDDRVKRIGDNNHVTRKRDKNADLTMDSDDNRHWTRSRKHRNGDERRRRSKSSNYDRKRSRHERSRKRNGDEQRRSTSDSGKHSVTSDSSNDDELRPSEHLEKYFHDDNRERKRNKGKRREIHNGSEKRRSCSATSDNCGNQSVSSDSSSSGDKKGSRKLDNGNLDHFEWNDERRKIEGYAGENKRRFRATTRSGDRYDTTKRKKRSKSTKSGRSHG